MHFFINIKTSALHAIRFGSGKRLLICFHGFGEDAEKYRALQPSLSEMFTIVAVDLPYHGNSKWQAGELFLQEDLVELIRKILDREKQERFSLMGYSLGGKIVLAAVHHFAPQLDVIILAAPDGVMVNSWYNVAVYPEWGRKLFKRFVVKPGVVFTAARVLRFLRVLNNSLYKFLQAQTNTEEKRRKVYNVWMTIKDFEVSLPEVKQLLNRYQVRSYIFIGKYDKVITQAAGEKFAAGLAHCNYVLLEKGHNLITEALNEPLTKALNA